MDSQPKDMANATIEKAKSIEVQQEAVSAVIQDSESLESLEILLGRTTGAVDTPPQSISTQLQTSVSEGTASAQTSRTASDTLEEIISNVDIALLNCMKKAIKREEEVQVLKKRFLV